MIFQNSHITEIRDDGNIAVKINMKILGKDILSATWNKNLMKR
jgi:hypothetical protein